jgi:hypothetical protein
MFFKRRQLKKTPTGEIKEKKQLTLFHFLKKIEKREDDYWEKKLWKKEV